MGLKLREHRLEQELLRSALDQAGAKRTQDRVVKPGIREL